MDNLCRFRPCAHCGQHTHRYNNNNSGSALLYCYILRYVYLAEFDEYASDLDDEGGYDHFYALVL